MNLNSDLTKDNQMVRDWEEFKFTEEYKLFEQYVHEEKVTQEILYLFFSAGYLKGFNYCRTFLKNLS